jgi:hypothetical protein
MAGRGRGKGKGRRDGLTLQLPSHVQNSLNKEERMLHQTLGDIDRETKHRLKCISQDQQVAATKLKLLERRLLMSQARSRSAAEGGSGSTEAEWRRQIERRSVMSRMNTCDSSYFKSLMTPAIRDTTDLFEEAQLGTQDYGDKSRKTSVIGGSRGSGIGSGLQRPQKSALKRREGEGSAGGGGERRRSSVSFSAGSDYSARRKSVSFR